MKQNHLKIRTAAPEVQARPAAPGAGGVIFGYFTTFCNYMVSFLPTPENLVIRVGMVLASTVFVAIGIFFYLPADLIPLAGEGAMQAVSSVTGIEFPKVKIGFDCTMVLVSVITCLTCLHSLGSVGAGTVIAAVLVGTLVGVLNRAFGKRRDVIMGREAKRIQHTAGYQQKTGLQVEL